jgi:hypothetical protein
MTTATKSHILLALLFLISIFLFAGKSYAVTSQTVDAKVKLGICGNDLAEDNEDCDNADLKGNTCETLGYASGTLSCLPSCDFDTTLCVPKVPSSGGNNNVFESHNKTTSTTTQEAILYTLPEVIRIFDTNGDGKLSLNELYGITKKWFDVWAGTLADQIQAGNQGSQAVNKQAWTCDLNKDGSCDLIDFSILMYYVNR